MPTLSCRGVDLHYQQTGQGPAILLLAGIASDSASWNPVLPALAEFATVYTIDNRCAGQTRPLAIDTSRDLIVQDVIALLDTCQLDKVTLIGHSMGALNSWAVAADVPDRINAVVAASAPFTVDPTRIELFNTLARLRTDDNEADWFRLLFHFLFSPAFFENANAIDDAVEAALAYKHKQPRSAFLQQCAALTSYLEPIALPTTLPFACMALTGANDKMFTPEDMRAKYATHPEIKLSVIENAAHSVHWENPEAFVNAVQTFLNWS